MGQGPREILDAFICWPLRDVSWSDLREMEQGVGIWGLRWLRGMNRGCGRRPGLTRTGLTTS
jgi:hypothetical protein